jgi:hypothetical protein
MINTNTTDRLSEKRGALTAVRTDLSPAAVKDMLTRVGESSPLSFEIRASAQASLSGGSKSNRSSERVVHGIRNVTEDATRPSDGGKGRAAWGDAAGSPPRSAKDQRASLEK